MNGGREEPYENEDRGLIPSPKVATYDLQPEMSLEHLTESLTANVEKGYDLIICNVANGDMVGHTGSMPAAIAAVEAIDTFMSKLLPVLEKTGSQMLVTADHGNCEEMLDDDNNVLTKHSTNPVPVCYFGEKELQLKDGGLADLAPTILSLMNLEIPEEMTGSVIVK
jgi:2,3-bisphosphoglycerate-independent phosphoglycerate mutase